MKILLLVLCAFLYSCIDSEAVVSQKESEEIAISAFILGQDSTQIKDTTITLNDSILLIGNIFPERKNHIQKFFWKTPENAFYKEFQIQVKPNFPGDFTYHFFVIDFHGDSLSDSIQIHVSTPPVLDSNSFLPENNSSRLPPDSLIFSWLASDDDKDELFYQFKLFQDENLIIDTSLNETFFKLPFDLQALESYRWELSVFDSKGIQGNTLISTFSTGTKSNKARFRGEISIFPDTLLSQIILTLESKDSSQILSLQNGFFDSKEIPPGDYKLSAKLPSYADYKTESISVTLKKGDFLDKLSQYVIIDGEKIRVLNDDEFDMYFGNIPVVYLFYGYPNIVKSMLYERNANFKVLGYKECYLKIKDEYITLKHEVSKIITALDNPSTSINFMGHSHQYRCHYNNDSIIYKVPSLSDVSGGFNYVVNRGFLVCEICFDDLGLTYLESEFINLRALGKIVIEERENVKHNFFENVYETFTKKSSQKSKKYCIFSDL